MNIDMVLSHDAARPEPGELTLTDQGFAECWVVVAAPCDLRYAQPDGTIKTLRVTAKTLSNSESYDTLKNCPVFINHNGGAGKPDSFEQRSADEMPIGSVIDVVWDDLDQNLKALIRLYPSWISEDLQRDKSDRQILAVSPSYHYVSEVRDGITYQIDRLYYDLSILIGVRPRCPDAVVLVDSDDLAGAGSTQVEIEIEVSSENEEEEVNLGEETMTTEMMDAMKAMLEGVCTKMDAMCSRMDGMCTKMDAMCSSTNASQDSADDLTKTAFSEGFAAGVRRTKLELAAGRVGVIATDMSDIDLANAIADKIAQIAQDSSSAVSTSKPATASTSKPATANLFAQAEENRKALIASLK